MKVAKSTRGLSVDTIKSVDEEVEVKVEMQER
jgi:hypothetical protein